MKTRHGLIDAACHISMKRSIIFSHQATVVFCSSFTSVNVIERARSQSSSFMSSKPVGYVWISAVVCCECAVQAFSVALWASISPPSCVYVCFCASSSLLPWSCQPYSAKERKTWRGWPLFVCVCVCVCAIYIFVMFSIFVFFLSVYIYIYIYIYIFNFTVHF